MLVGRKKEIKLLQSLVQEEESQFVAVFGRRRIGKTFLIREVFDYKFTFQHTGISNNQIPPGKRKKSQLEKFEESLKNVGYNCETSLTSWSEAFNCLKEVIIKSSDNKKIIFIDELSWMDTKDSGFVSALESFWNGWVTARREKDVVLIVCASATYWMIDNIVNSKGGLHNRLTAQIYLKPFTLGECEEYLVSKNINFTRNQIVQCYMIMGGVPYYWSLIKKGLSLPQNIDEIFFSETAILANEYENLYSALFNKPEAYLKIVEAISTTNKGLTKLEISKKTGCCASGDLTKKLTELENCGFIRKYTPYGCVNKNSIYQLIDNYTLFYHQFIKKKTYDSKFWENQINSPAINSWSGFSFERVCLEHIDQIKMALGISGVQTEVNAWQCQRDDDAGIYGSQIDLLIVRKDQIINLCEMKYSNSGYVVDANFSRDMRRKISDFTKKTKTKYAIYPTLITTYDIMQNVYADELQSIITSDDLFK